MKFKGTKILEDEIIDVVAPYMDNLQVKIRREGSRDFYVTLIDTQGRALFEWDVISANPGDVISIEGLRVGVKDFKIDLL